MIGYFYLSNIYTVEYCYNKSHFNEFFNLTKIILIRKKKSIICHYKYVHANKFQINDFFKLMNLLRF